ncbi:TetR/AcrR family transcriptional regulator [Roseburia sp. OF03-24]|uniref:TetR/AcrR family transcriptional regulator n=1 Tax=Roseburia sp. OF03-24 TaxID=2292367 RepID=UPI001FA927BD|nr:TetR/AcrR family transcriptional regulator [Roseburia sp. OF03-24]
MNELCDEATIRRATFYKHFADKYDFFSFFIRQKQDQFISQAKEETPPNGIYAYTLYLTQRSILYFKEHESLIQNILKSDMSASPLDIFNEEIHSNILSNLKEHQQRSCTFSVSPELLASFLSGGIFSTIRNSVLQPQLFNTDTIMENMSKVLTCLETLTDQSTENF